MRILPKKYQASHDFAFFLHDILVKYIVDGEKSDWYLSQFKFKRKSHIDSFEGLEGEEIFEWFRANGYNRVQYDVTYRTLILGILSDLCHFVYEGLRCSEKGKLTVAYSLFRKPFKDNLLLLEWLLVDPVGFLRIFETDADRYAPDKVSVDEKMQLIKKALCKIATRSALDSKFLYEFRYDKKAEHGLEALWNSATHLVTTCRSYRTETSNLNFLFSGEEEQDEQWDYLYLIIPYLLFYTVEVVEQLIFTLVKFNEGIITINCLRRQLRFILWSKERGHDNEISEVDQLFKELEGEWSIPCLNCSGRIRLDKGNTYRLAYNNLVVCPACRQPLSFKGLSRSIPSEIYKHVHKIRGVKA